MEQVAKTKTTTTTTTTTAENTNAKANAKAEAKRAAAKAFNDRQNKLKAERALAIEELKNFFASKKLEMPPKVKEWVEHETSTRSSGSSLFNKVFGDNPKVGDSVTVIDYLKRTLKAKADLDKAVKAWAEKGIIVEYKEAAKLLESTYVITKM